MILNRPEAGTYVGVEGVGGVGKTYFAELVESRINATLVSEIPQSGLGHDILEAIANDDEFFRHGYPVVEGLLFFAMKEYSIKEEVVPNLESNRTVIQDRPFYSTSIYAAVITSRHSQKSTTELFNDFNDIRRKLTFRPDINIYLYDDFENCLERIEKREGRTFQDDEIAIMDEMHSFYEKLAEQCPDEFYKIHVGANTEEEVIEKITNAINDIN